MFNNKRGAVELSITTIVVVVIGVTLLVLGLTFVYNIFTDIGEQQKQLGEFTDEKIRDIFEQSDQFLNLPTTDFSVELGKTYNFNIIIKNNAQGVNSCNFGLDATYSGGGTINPINWITFSQDTGIRVGAGDTYKIRMQIKPTTGAQLGDYLITLRLLAESCIGFISGETVGSPEPITIRVV